jgi:hypothetical protein
MDLFIISYELDELDEVVCCGIYTDLEIAKRELKNIYNRTADYKYFGYKIMIYTLGENQYKFTNKILTYSFDEFHKN